MQIIYPILSILGGTIGQTLDKVNYNKNKILPIQELWLNFSVMFVFAVGIFMLTVKSIPTFTPWIIFLLITLVVTSFLQNIFSSSGVFQKEMSYRELFIGFEPILTSFMAFIFFPSEREIKYIIGIILAVIILCVGNYKKQQKFKFDKGVCAILLGVLFAAIVSNIYKFGLEFLSPELLFLVRVFGVFVFIVLFRLLRKIKLPSISIKAKKLGIFAGLSFGIGAFSRLLSIEHLGLNLTILILFLKPVLIYFFSVVVLKEKLNAKRVVSNILLLLLVVLLSVL